MSLTAFLCRLYISLFAYGTSMPVMCLLVSASRCLLEVVRVPQNSLPLGGQVNVGGLALVRRLRSQIRDSVRLIPLSRDDGLLESAGRRDVGVTKATIPEARVPEGVCDSPLSVNVKLPSSPSSDKSPLPSPRAGPRSLSFSDVKRIAMRDAEKAPGQIVSPAGLQARKVIELKKAERDLILVSCLAARSPL